MTTARDIMHGDAKCVGADESLASAARMMRDLGVGALPICGADDRLGGIITDRDIVINCVAEGRDPASTRAGDLGKGKPLFVRADADLDTVLNEMMTHRVMRMPVIDDKRLVGMISEADLARNLSGEKLGALVEAIKSGPADRVV
ncbi:CBS domain-containing protein [Frankia sp. Mgl5]|uniref:CBS domain-containing protein n=1 Tax=Frankia sp. Mgl5 TaxID=2933793 RepID=UPI00200D47D6|nr:CBS domain-containing protein [Frankia sp. Mgl5]MCK9929491.1 CBS domain-containing protein [Frankia sp. Mgl5]